MNTRSRALLNLAHRVQQCTNCDWFTEGCEPAHENGINAGKGFGIKGQDNRHAALCHACHVWYDQGIGMDPSKTWQDSWGDKGQMWQRAHMRTMDLYWAQGWIRVAA